MIGARVTSVRPALLVAVSLLVASAQAFAQAAPELPRASVDTSMPAQGGRTIAVGAGGDFQAALDMAQPGDTITLAAGATYVGPFTLPNKAGGGWIVVRTSAPDSALPAAGQRITPAYAGALPKVVSTAYWPALQTADGAHHFRFVGVEFGIQNAPFSYGVVVLGDGNQTSLDRVVHHIVLDRVLVRGQGNIGVRRGIALNSADTAVINSWISEIQEANSDTQAIAGWNGPGPYRIENNYIAGAGENIMFGGGDPAVYGLVPSDITIARNTISKPLEWRGSAWTLKNLIELKNAQRVLIDGNLIEQNWASGQVGWAVLVTPRNQDGRAPWSVTQDISFTNNILRRAGAGITVLGRDNLQASQPTRRIRIANNLFAELGGAWAGPGRMVQLLDSPSDVTIEHNTGFPATEYLIFTGAVPGIAVRHNLLLANQYGVAGDGTYGNVGLTLATFAPGGSFTSNAVIGANPVGYPAGNLFPPSLDSVGFVNLAGGDFRLSSSSPYRGTAGDGRDPGVDFAAMTAAMGGQPTSTPAPAPQPPPAPPASTTVQVGVTAPSAGQTVSGIITLSASASNAASVQFLIDGIEVSAQMVQAPFTAQWNSTWLADGAHSVVARARDAAGNATTSAAVSFTIRNNGGGGGAPAPAPAPSPSPTNGAITWVRQVNVTANGGTVVKAAGCDTCPDAGTSSAESFSGEGGVEFTIGQTTAQLVVGLGQADYDTSEGDVDVGIKFWPGGHADVRLGGRYQGGEVDYAAGDTFGIRVTPGQVQFTRNGQVFHRLDVTVNGPLAVDTAFVMYGRIDGVRLINAAAAVAWTRQFNVSVEGGTIVKTGGCDGCQDAGATSSRSITSGSGYVQFSPGDTGSQRVIGLSTGNTDTSEEGVDFALKFWPGGTVDVRENGIYLAEIRYSDGDLFRIAVQNGTVSYTRNGQEFYRSGRPAAYPLLVDTSFTTMGGRFVGVTLVTQ